MPEKNSSTNNIITSASAKIFWKCPVLGCPQAKVDGTWEVGLVRGPYQPVVTERCNDHRNSPAKPPP